MEIWVDIPSTSGLYQASSFGRIRRAKPARGTRVGKVLRPSRNVQTGVLCVVLRVNGKSLSSKVHRLVAEAFLGFYPDLEVCHNDGNLDNNMPDNLRWDTHQANMDDMIRHGTRLYGDRHQNTRISDQAVIAILEDSRSHAAIGREYGVCGQYIGKIKSGQYRKLRSAA